MSGSRLEITSKSPVSHDATVRLDGVEIQNALRGLKLSMGVDEVTRAELDVCVVETTDVAVGVHAFIPPETRDLLIRLGWTPPEDGKEPPE